MGSKDHQSLVNVIRGVHQKLRKAFLSCGDFNTVWTEHLKEQDLREKYASAMFTLATEVWKGKECRIEWTYNTCMNYFFKGGLERSLIRQIKKNSLQKQPNNFSLSESFEDPIQEIPKNVSQKLKLLDVGSCYNPFSKFEEFSCVAIDLTPATKDVLQFDFLSIEVKSKTYECPLNKNCKSLFYEESYDVVVFSLVLEYLPSSVQRAAFCYKAWQLLKENGLCVIITPDSKSVNHNAHMMKSWKLALEKIGFIRVKYDKLQHVHCIAFRKIKIENDKLPWDFVSERLFIPQDFNKYTQEEPAAERTEEDCFDICNNFLELPSDDVL